MMVDCCTRPNEIQEIRIDFGEVYAGTIAKRSFKILNKGCKKQYYKIHRDPKTNLLHNVFRFEFENWILHPGDSVDCRIEYCPMLPFYYDIDYFSISDCDCMCYKILVQGNCTGPNVISSVPRLLMICPKGIREVKRRLQLTNNSGVAAIFMFDIELTHCPFKVDITSGTIGPNSHINVTITFSPSRKGLYAFYLSCLIHHQNPIVTELYGYRGSSFTNAEELSPLMFSDPEPLIRDFEGYMSDAVTIVKSSYPPISLSDTFLDFGRVEFDRKKTHQDLPKNISFTNHSHTDFVVQWDEDPDHVFTIKPNRLTIRGQQSGLFEVHFVPNKPDSLFSREILAHACWKVEIIKPTSKSTSALPVPIPLIASIRMIGQSFSFGSIGWIPQCEVPRTVILPPCLPSMPVYTTFLIKLYGYLPITFRFIPPPMSQFTVKPMVGLIRREYQIVALQLFPKVADECKYIEQWKIQFNGNSKNEVHIEFRASAEYPEVIFNHNNTVEFAPVYPQCEQVSQVTMRNMTRHCIRYSFPDLPSEIKLEEISGVIQANQILTYNWISSPKEIGNYKYEIQCCLTTLKAGCPVGTDINVPVVLVGRAERGYLVALPEELNFGNVNYGETKKLSFHAFNFSSVEIHYKLRCDQRGWPIGDVARDIQVQPETKTIQAGSNAKIDVCITPREPGFYQLMMKYSLRANSVSKSVVDTVETRDICILNCMCMLSGFEDNYQRCKTLTHFIMFNSGIPQVKDLLYFTHSEHLSKASLWNLLEINKYVIIPIKWGLDCNYHLCSFNVIIKSIIPGEEKALNLRFPELVVCEDPLLIKLLIVNSAPTQSTWTLSRVKKCDCQQVVKSRGFTFKYKVYSCNHRLACTISPKKGVLLPRQQAILTVEVRYILLGKTTLQWRLELSNNRKIIINADVVALSNTENRPTLLAKQVLSLEKIYIGDLDAMNQLVWMYNSMDHEVSYSLDVSALHRINIENWSDTFSCQNPCGIIPKRSYYPIILKFQPRCFESFTFNLPLKLGQTSTNLAIEAETAIFHKTRFYPERVPTTDQFSIPELPVYFSVEHILIPVMPMHSKVNRMMMIVNESKNEVIGYRWRSYSMPKILEIEVEPKSGRIQPTKGQSFCISIKSIAHTCKITANVSCQFLNLSAQRTYEKSVLMYNSLCEELAGQFIITETGITEPKPWLKLAVKPKPFYKSLSISCYIYSSMDMDLKATVEDQLKSPPPVEIRIKTDESCSVTDRKLIDNATFILESMIWDILNSNIFLNTLKKSLVKVPNVKYGQYVIPPMERRKLNNRSYNLPPRHFLESILEKVMQAHPSRIKDFAYMFQIFPQMIFSIVHEEFGLSLYHFNGPEDIRQFCYQKRDRRSTLQTELYKSNLKDPSDHLDSEDEIKNGSKEFHLESQVQFNVEHSEDSSDD